MFMKYTYLLLVFSLTSLALAHEDAHTNMPKKTYFPVLFRDEFNEFFELAAGYIDILGGLILVLAAARSIFHGIQKKVYRLIGKKGGMSMDENRVQLGNTIAFSLELLITSDVIETLTKNTHDISMEMLYKIGLIVIIRTVLSYFLGKELEEIEHHMDHHAHAHAPENEEKKKSH